MRDTKECPLQIYKYNSCFRFLLDLRSKNIYRDVVALVLNSVLTPRYK